MPAHNAHRQPENRIDHYFALRPRNAAQSGTNGSRADQVDRSDDSAHLSSSLRMLVLAIFAIAFFCCPSAFAQLPSRQCDSTKEPWNRCEYLTTNEGSTQPGLSVPPRASLEVDPATASTAGSDQNLSG